MTLRTLYRQRKELKRIYRRARGGERTRALRNLKANTTAILKLQVSR